MVDQIGNKLGNFYRSVTSSIRSLPTESRFIENGTLTPQEFIATGDHLTHRCPTWTWQSSMQGYEQRHFPAEKQFLITRGVPCRRRANDLKEDNKYEDTETEDGWVISHVLNEDQEQIVEISNPEPLQEIINEDIPDLEDIQDQDLIEDANEVPLFNKGYFCGSEPEDGVLRTRIYDLSVTYDTYYHTPRLWLVGYDEYSNPLTPDQMFEDIMGDYIQKTVTLETHPCLGSRQLSIHPCNHGKMMKHFIDTMISNGKHQSQVLSVQISKTGKFVASGSADQSIRLWDVQNPLQNKTIIQGHDGTTSICISNNEEYIISGHMDCTVRLWNVKQAFRNKVIGEHQDYVLAVCCSKDNRQVISGSQDGTVRLWDLYDLSLNKIIGKHKGSVYSVSISNSKQFAVSGGFDKTVKLWSFIDPCHNKIVGIHSHLVTSVCIGKSEQIIISGSYDHTIRLWNLYYECKSKIIGSHDSLVYTVCLSKSERIVISGSWDRQIRLWDLNNSIRNRVIGKHQGLVLSVSISENERMAVTGGGDNVISLWSS